MKKVVLILLALCAVLTLSACKPTEKIFSVEGMKLTLTSDFEEAEAEGYTAALDSGELAVLILKQKISDFPSGTRMTLSDYATMMCVKYTDKKPSKPVLVEDYYIMEFSLISEENDVTYKHFVAMFKGANAFWTVQFVCDREDYASLENTIAKYVASIQFGA